MVNCAFDEGCDGLVLDLVSRTRVVAVCLVDDGGDRLKGEFAVGLVIKSSNHFACREEDYCRE